MGNELYTMTFSKNDRIESINIEIEEGRTQDCLSIRDRETALRDLEYKSAFKPNGHENGPYTITLSIDDNRLVFNTKDSLRNALPILILSLTPYRRLIKDYFLIVQSYNEAIAGGNPSRIEAIDMGRRGLHNEGAELLQERLNDKIEMDLGTARCLFTLICILHTGKTHILR